MRPLEAALAAIDAKRAKPVYVVTGEEYLVRRASDAIVARLVPKAMAGLNVSLLEGVGPAEVANDLATVPMFRDNKVVLVREPEFLAPKRGRQHALGAVRDAWNGGRREAAARRALALAARAGWGVAQLDPTADGAPSVEDWKRELDVELAGTDVGFLREVAAFCKERGIAVPESATTALEAILEKGIPPGHHLVIESQAIDRKATLFRLCERLGLVLEHQVAADVHKLSIDEAVEDVLRPEGKRLSPAAGELLKDLCGGSMRLVRSELEKLATYVGDRTVIETSDVEQLVLRSREDGFFDLSNALYARDTGALVEHIDRALAQGEAPLKLHGALASMVRKLIAERDRVDRLHLRLPMSYEAFKTEVFPTVAEEANAAGMKSPHPYAAYQAMLAAQRFSMRELLAAHRAVAAADLALKSSANGRLTIESLAWDVCGPR